MRIAAYKAVGSYLPEKILTNAELEAKIDTSDEWIRERTGIAQRHIAAEGEVTSDLAAKAAQRALERAAIDVADVDLIVVATTTPDETFPATATRVQHKIGAAGVAFDLQAACSGFVYGLSVADSMIRSGQVDTAVVIGAETYSRIVDWDDRGTCILFGDGAGAVVLQAEEVPEGTKRGILHSYIRSDGKYADILKTTGGVSSTQTAGNVFMQGRDVFRHAVAKMGEALTTSLEAAGKTIDDVDWVIPHQANIRIINTMGDKLGLGPEKVIATMGLHANTSAASIPLALDVATTEGKIKSENLLAMPALGAGLTWGCSIIQL